MGGATTMYRFIIKRLGFQIFVLLGLTLFTFSLMYLLPGDPAASISALTAGGSGNAEDLAAFRQLWGLDQPLYIQYLSFLGNILTGDLGTSMVSNRSIMHELATFFPATAELAVAALVLVVLIGVPVGVLAAVYRNHIIDHIVRIITVVGVSMPIFWLAILALVVFFGQLGWVPSSQRIGILDTPPERVTGFYTIDSLIAGDFSALASSLHHLILPASILAISGIALIARIVRASMLDVLGQDYIRTARAKGLKNHVVLIRHALRNALIPFVTSLGLLVGALLSGTVLTETIFSWPGIGRFAVQSVFYLDRPAVLGVTLLVGVIYAVVNLSVDILVARLDPRIQY